jgi:asparagine synthase (glutamine-hydrolysing)
VKLRLVSDVPVGAFLSGGIDSGAVVGLMSRLSDHPVQTFSIGSTTQTHNELPDAERIANRFATDHHSIVVEPDIVHLLPKLVDTYEEPYADPSAIPTYLIARETRTTVTVALNGDGGDENFAGYVRYPILKFAEGWRRVPQPLHWATRHGTNAFHRVAGSTLSYRSQRFQHSIHHPFEQRFLQYISFFTESEKRALYKEGLGKDFPETAEWYAARTKESRDNADTLIHKAMHMDFDTYLPDDLLPKVDLGSMAHGLEARSPFLDHELLELTACTPSSLKLKGFTTKWILKETLKGFLPTETLEKRKSGFRLPLDRWFRSDLKEFVREGILDGPDVMWQMFDRGKLEDFLDRYHKSRTDYSDHLWALLWLSTWLRRYTEAQ